MTKDLNKGIDQIRYNYLDKPVSIVLSGSEADSLTYTYSAAGSKLGMQVWKDGTEQSSVDYIGSFRYEDGELKSFAHAEGRIVLKEVNNETKYDYRYHLTDHQGNTRRVLSTLHEEYTSIEDFEGGDNGFTDLHPITNSNANTTTGGSKVERLQIGQTGAMIMLRMDKGDTVDLSVMANYAGTPSGNTFATIGYDALFNSWSAALGGSVEGGVPSGAESQFEDALGGAGMNGKGNSSTAPRAFLNYIFFDLDMKYEAAGFKQISTAALGLELLEINDIIVSKSGYLFAYLSNENQEAVNIHFDDFEIRHAKTNVVQAVDYYPFGMEAMTYTRTAADPTKYLYNGGVEKNDLTSYYETFYRQYDASIGRFTGIDVKASSFSSLTPYNYAFNDPVTYNDPLGDCPTCSGRPGSLLDELHRKNKSGSCFACDGGGSGGNGGAGFSGMRQAGGYGGYAYDEYKKDIYENQLLYQAKSGDYRAELEYIARHGESDNAAATELLASSFEWIEIWMQQVWSDGTATQIDGQGRVHVYTDPKIIAGVLDYYINKLPTLQEFYRNGGSNSSTERKWRQGGISLVGDSPGPIEQQDGMASHTMTLDGLTARSKKPGGRWFRGIAESLNSFKEWIGVHPDAKKIPNVVVSPSSSSYTPTYFYGDSIERKRYLDDNLRSRTVYDVNQYKVFDGDTTLFGVVQRSHKTKTQKVEN